MSSAPPEPELAEPHSSLVVYAAIIGFGLGGLSLILAAGHDLREAPQLPEVVAVAGPLADCVGDRLTVVQSGVYLDLYATGAGIPASGAAPPGGTVARGTVDRSTGSATLRGTCRSGTPRAGRPFRIDALVDQRGDAADHAVAATADLGDGREPVTLRATSASAAGAAGGSGDDRAPLAGSELAGRLFLSVAVVIVAARTLGTLFTRIRQPRVAGEIAAGIVLGPSLVGLVVPGVTEFLYPPEVIDVLRMLAQFGLVFFMFLIGLHLDLSQVARSGRTAVLVSHVSIVAPLVLGAAGALVVYPRLGDGEFAGFALFMGAAMAVTAFPVLARILTDTGLDRTRLGALAITCAAVDDVTAWCLLAVVVAIVRSGGPGDVVQMIGQTALFVVVMLGPVRRLVARAAAAQAARGGLDAGVLAVVAVGLLLSAWLSEEIGIHAIFGAFLAGVVVPRSDGLPAQLASRLEDVTSSVLLPIFFAVVGLSTRFGLLAHAELWWVAGLVVALAVVGKWCGSTLAARACAVPWREATALGVLMNTRGLTEIVILTVGLEIGVISPTVFTIMVLMALVTTFMATPLLTVILPRPAPAGAPGSAEPTRRERPVSLGHGAGNRPSSGDRFTSYDGGHRR